MRLRRTSFGFWYADLLHTCLKLPHPAQRAAPNTAVVKVYAGTQLATEEVIDVVYAAVLRKVRGRETRLSSV